MVEKLVGTDTVEAKKGTDDRIDAKTADSKEKNGIWSPILIALMVVLILPVAFVFFMGFRTPEALLSVLLGISVIALVVALTFTTFIFKSLGLANPNGTLGLPEGSIRAVIALSLILIFMISSVFLYNQVSSPDYHRSSNISQAEFDTIDKDQILSYHSYNVVSNRTGNVTIETQYNVTVKTEKNEDSVDIAQQIITTVSTLVVAVAGFYFGTNAVATASKAVPGAGGEIAMVPEPLVRDVNPKSMKRGGKEDLTITGKNLESVKEVKIVRESTELKCTDIMSNGTKIVCTLAIPKPTEKDPDKPPLGTYAVVVVNSALLEDSLPDAFTVLKEDEEKK